MKVLFLSNMPSPYSVDFFNILGRKCDVTVYFDQEFSEERDTSWRRYSVTDFQCFIGNKEYGDKGSAWKLVKRLIMDTAYDAIVLEGYNEIRMIYANILMRIYGIRFWIRADGGLIKKDTFLKKRIKSFLIKAAYGYISSCEECGKYFLHYGAKKEQIYQCVFSSLREEDILSDVVGKDKKEQIRRELKIEEQQVIVSVGQFIYRKGYDILLNAMGSVSREVGLYLLGGVPTEEYLDIVAAQGLQRVHFIGFQPPEVVAQYYQAADIFVLPTREDIWGLVINEAMAKGLPIITTDRCEAGLELVDESNGFIVKAGDADELALRMNIMLNDCNLEEMGKNSLRKIRDYTMEPQTDF